MALSRWLYALPILLPVAFTLRAMAMLGPLDPVVDEAYSQGRYILQDGTSVPILRGLFGIPGFDYILARIAITFSPLIFYEDPKLWWQCIVFVPDVAGVAAIIMFESLRNANKGTFFQASVVPLFLAQVVTLGNTAPPYLYFFYVLSPLKKYSAASARQIDEAGMIAVLPTLFVVFFIPHGISLLHHDLEIRHMANWYWQTFPVSGSILLFALSSVIRPLLDNQHIETARQRSKAGLNFIGGTMATLSAASYWFMLLSSPLPVSELFIPKYLIEFPIDPLTALLTLFQYDCIISYTSMLLWLAYNFGDLKNAGLCQLSWARIFLYSVVIGCLGGPGALIWIGWLTREAMMANTAHAKIG